MAELLLYCRRDDGSVAAVELPVDATVAQLREAAAAACGAGGHVRLTFSGTELRDGPALADIGLSMQATVDVSAMLNSQTVLSAGVYHTLAILEDGSVVAWGSHDKFRCDIPDFGGLRAVSVAAGESHSLALLQDGTIAAWGNDSDGQASVPERLREKKAVRIAAGGSYGNGISMAVFDDGTAVLWGDCDVAEYQLKDPASSVHARIDCGGAFGAFCTDGTLQMAEDSDPVALGHDVIAVTAMDASAVMLLANCSVKRISFNDDEQEVLADHGSPLVVSVSAGSDFGLMLRDDGTVESWGSGDLGEATVDPKLFGGERVVAVSAGCDFSCVGLESGRVVAWGQNDDGESTVPDFGGRRLLRPTECTV